MPHLTLPDFIIGGAPRCATTWLYQALDHHPDVYMAKPFTPEPKFFLVDSLYEQGLETYAALFADKGEHQLAGEKSTNYLESRTAAKRIHAHLPEARLVFILRNPVARAFNNYLWSRRHDMESQSFRRALELEPERERACPEKLRYARPHALFSRGLYAEHISHFLELFPRERILCLNFDDLEVNPEALLQSLHSFLEIPFRPQDAQIGVVNDIPEEQVETIPEDLRQQLSEAYQEPNRQLEELLGQKFGWDES